MSVIGIRSLGVEQFLAELRTLAPDYKDCHKAEQAQTLPGINLRHSKKYCRTQEPTHPSKPSNVFLRG